MRELHSVVVRHLKTKRESEGAIALWNKLWAALEKGGAEAVEELIAELAEMPKSDDDEIAS
jgi:hypothetical protein